MRRADADVEPGRTSRAATCGLARPSNKSISGRISKLQRHEGVEAVCAGRDAERTYVVCWAGAIRRSYSHLCERLANKRKRGGTLEELPAIKRADWIYGLGGRAPGFQGTLGVVNAQGRRPGGQHKKDHQESSRFPHCPDLGVQNTAPRWTSGGDLILIRKPRSQETLRQTPLEGNS